MNTSNMNRRVVITGVGPISSVGIGRSGIHQALLSRQPSNVEAREFDGTNLEGLKLATIGDFAIRDYLPAPMRKMAKIMCRDIQLAVASSMLAMKDAGLSPDALDDRSRWGCISGAGVTNVEHADIAPAFIDCMVAGNASSHRWGNSSMNLLPPLMVLKYLPNMAASHITILHRLTGISNTITCGEPSGHISIGEGYNAVRRGTSDLIVCGGAESKIHPTNIVYEHIQGRLSDDVAPLGEGAGYLVLENMQTAMDRKANILAEVKGYSVRQSLGHTATEQIAGLKRAASSALEKAQIEQEALSIVIPSGTGTLGMQNEEISMLQQLFGSRFASKRLDARRLLGNCFAGNSLDVIAAALLASDRNGNVLSLARNEDGQNAALVIGSFAA